MTIYLDSKSTPIRFLVCLLILISFSTRRIAQAQQDVRSVMLVYLPGTTPVGFLIGSDSNRVMSTSLGNVSIQPFYKFVISDKALVHLAKFVTDRCPLDVPYGHGKVDKTIIASVFSKQGHDPIYCPVTAPITTATYFKDMAAWLQSSKYGTECKLLIAHFESLQ